MTTTEADKLRQEFDRCSSLRALEILQLLHEGGWVWLAQMLEAQESFAISGVLTSGR